MKLAAIQFRPQKADWHGSADTLCNLIRLAGTQGARLIVCPEMALTGYLFPDARSAAAVAEVCPPPNAADAAEATDRSPTFRRLSPLARDLGCYLVIGYPERTEASPSLLYNSALIIGPDGRLLCNYRKRLLYECDETWALPGDLPYPLLPTPLGLLSAGICMDLNDDRFTAFLRRKQPDLIAFCTNWLHQGIDILPYWRQRLRGVHGVFIAANTYGKEQEGQEGRECGGEPMRAHFLGRSAVLDGHGRVLGLAPETGDGVILTAWQGPQITV